MQVQVPACSWPAGEPEQVQVQAPAAARLAEQLATQLAVCWALALVLGC